jgi:serine/threonine protein phosphatase PrpC
MTNNSSINIETNNISNYNLFLEENQNLNINNTEIFTFIGICDGHGDQGKTISNYLANRIPVKMKHYLDTISYNISKDNFSQEIEPNIKSIFQAISTRLNSMQSIDTSYSGSCFCSLLITPSSIISINVGNSKAIIGIPNNNSGENTYIPYNLNYEHTSLIQNEKERIINNGGYVLYEKDEYNREYGPLKVWKKDSLLPGLLPTRTFGDKESSSIGIISEPEIQFFEMKDNFKFIVVGSNGFWSFISSEECIQIISKYYLEDDIHGAVNTVMNIAKSRWIEQKEEIIEDISIIISFFKEFKL